MAGPVEEGRQLKLQARSHRDAGDTAAAVRALRAGIDALEGTLRRIGSGTQSSGAVSTPADADEAAIGRELADLYGMLGGTLREQGDLRAAAAAYDRGFRVESDRRYGLRSTYNALNRLTTRLLLCPACLADPELLRREPAVEFLDLRQELVRLHEQLHRDVTGTRSGDFWAAGDLAVACALNGDEPGVGFAIEQFAGCSPPPGAAAAYHHSFEALARLNTPAKDTLVAAKAAWSRRLGS